MIRATAAIRSIGVFAFAGLFAVPAAAGNHTWDVSEVFSNADGTIQFVELMDPTGPNETGVGDGMISSNAQSHTWANGPVTGPTTNKFYLIATQGFADLSGAPTPDVILPSGVVPFFSTAGDSVAFRIYDTCTFGAVPTDGVTSLDCHPGSGATPSAMTNSPTNYAGATGSVSAAATPVPALGPAMHAIAAALLLGTGAARLRARRDV